MDSRPPGTTGTVAPAEGSRSPSTPAGFIDFAAVRVDKTTFEETDLGKVRFSEKAPYQATVLDGNADLSKIVAEMNALDHVMSSGIFSSPPSRVLRTSTEFLGMVKGKWLPETHSVVLRTPATGTAPPRRFEVVTIGGGREVPSSRVPHQAVHLGTVEINDVHYVRIVGGPLGERARLAKVLREVNARSGFSVRTAPPPGARQGSYGRTYERGTPRFFAKLRDALLVEDAILLPEGRKLPSELSLEGSWGKYADTSYGLHKFWLAVHVPTTLTIASASYPDVIQLSGPPGAPLGVRISHYGDVTYDAASLRAHVVRQYGTIDGFEAGSVDDVEIAGSKLLTMTFQTGRGPARAARLVALLPQEYAYSDKDEAARGGIAIELTAPGESATPPASRILAHPALATVMDSLFVDFDSAR